MISRISLFSVCFVNIDTLASVKAWAATRTSIMPTSTHRVSCVLCGLLSDYPTKDNSDGDRGQACKERVQEYWVLSSGQSKGRK